jgi:U3 small nucleolar RNA-associated protein 10
MDPPPFTDNLLVSANITSLLSFILQQAKSALPPARIFAHLILAHLLVKAKPDLQLALSYDVLACASGAVANDIESALNKHDQLSEGLILNVDDPTLLDKIYTKCSHGRTAVWMAEALIGTLASIRRPDSPIFWLVPGAHEDSVKQQYRRFAASLYAVVNLAGLSPGMSTNLLRALFWNLGEDALLFLASVWTESSVDIGVRCAALRHGQAFILACIGEKTRQDFQCVLPSVLAVLSDDSQELRRSAIGMIEAINKNVEEKSPRVYALERVYGSSSGASECGEVIAHASDVSPAC